VYEATQTDALLSGVEAQVEVSALPWLQVGGTTAIVEGTGENLDEQSAEDGDLPLLPANRFGGFMRWVPAGTSFITNPSLEVSANRVLDQDAAGRFEPFSQFDASFGPPFGTASTQAYTTVDIGAQGTFNQLGIPVTLSVRVRNLLDETYRDFLDTYKGYALSPGRDVQFSLSTSF
jgi:iron complex outermembrane receptor protein/hemoglobin/transferrin/lactoferrin receptor protein